ncbi:MAG: HAD-IC family P-type ATPase [Clostridia bacterium]|nr:HAD-IC family P-type ATPase [Clostridia bacterium]
MENPKQETTLRLPDALPEDFTRTPEGGLTMQEAQARFAAGQGNNVTEDPGKSVIRIFADNLLTMFNLLNLGLAVALALVGSWKNMTFMLVVFSNAFIATFQELRAKITVQKLQLMNESPVRVIREWVTQEIAPGECVRGDLLRLHAGDQVPADAIVWEGGCAAGEALLTGEQDAVPKKVGDWLYSGSYLIAGSCVAQLVNVGAESYINRLNKTAKTISQPKSELMTDLKKLIRMVSIALVPIGVLLLLKSLFIEHALLKEAIPPTVAAMIGMIPEGLMLLTSVALMVGVIKLARHRTLVQELYGIETLARVDTLCLDKTGTLTTGHMSLMELIPYDGIKEDELRREMARFLRGADLESPTMAAIAHSIQPSEANIIATLPFSSERKLSASSYDDGTTLVAGAPTFVLGEDCPEDLMQIVCEQADRGLRVLVLARCEGRIEEEKLPPIKQILGLAVLGDELRPNVQDTLEYFRKEGVTIKVISGDDPRTVATIAEKAGVEGALEGAVDVSALSDEEIDNVAATATVFGRVTPVRKQQLVEAMQRAGHSVGMTGDGVNDIPAMKTADCSIAMASGSDAARHAAQMILLDSDFTCMPRVVAEGRRVINNVTRSASLFLVKTIYSFALGLMMIALPASYPFEPLQLSLISVLTVGIPSFFLTLEPNEERVKERFLQGVLRRALPCAAAVTLCAAAAALMGRSWGEGGTQIARTLATLSAGSMGIYMLVTVCLPLTYLRGMLITLMAGGFIGAVLLFGDFFSLVRLTNGQVMILLGMIAAAAVLATFLRRMLNKRFGFGIKNKKPDTSEGI